MGVDQVVFLGRSMLQEVLLLSGPILLSAVVVSLLISVVQVLTSLQDQTVSIVPRLIAVGGIIFALMPWMWRHLAHYTLQLLGDFHSVMQ